MRKVLISVLLILLIILAYFTIFQGISIGTFKINSTQGIIQESNNLTQQIDDLNKKVKVDIQNKTQELSDSVSELMTAKGAYYETANTSTDANISKANTQERYTMDYLWLRIGSHAREEGVNIKLAVEAGNAGDNEVSNLYFTVRGQYVAIIDFVSSLEDDSELSFKIDNFKLKQEGDLLEATFDVSGVRIKQEVTNQTVEIIEETQNPDTTQQ